jgi:ankyrin repeat protein
VDAVLTTCSTLLALVIVDGSPVIQFSHFSVKEFLTSIRLFESTDRTLCRYSVSATPAHTIVAQACLGILLHLDMTITRDDLNKYPLAEYAARYWLDHARFKDVSQYIDDGMKQLFDPKAPHLAIWIWICDPRNPSMDSNRAERPSLPEGTPLHFAAVCGLHEIVKFLTIEHSQDIHSQRFDDQWTPLHAGSAYGHVEVARVLTENGANLTARAINRWTPLHVASRRGHIDVARFLVEHGADVMACDYGGKTPLHVATRWGHVDVSRFLIEQGTDATIQDYGGGTPLHDSSTYGYVELTNLLIERGADVSARAKILRTPLHEASTFGHVELARIFVEQGADMDARASDGRTPLHLASSYGYMDIARILVEHGADTTIQAHDGQNPLHVAASYGNLEISRILVEHGGDVTTRDVDGRTPLHSATSLQVVRFLVEHGADASVQDNEGRTAADVAAWKGHMEITDFLDEISPPPPQADDDETLSREEVEEDIFTEDCACATDPADNGWTPLHVAPEDGNVEVPWIHVEDADATEQANHGGTLLQESSSSSQEEVARRPVDEHGRDTARIAQGNRSYYYVLVFCVLCFVVGLLVHFM